MSSTTQWRGRSASGYTSSPRPRPSAVPPERKNGTSAPSGAATSVSWDARTGTCQRCASATQGGGGVGAAATEPRLERDPLFQMHADVGDGPRAPQRAPQRLGRLPHQVRAVERHAGRVAREGERPAGRRARDGVVQRHGLEHGAQLVEAVGPRARGRAGRG